LRECSEAMTTRDSIAEIVNRREPSERLKKRGRVKPDSLVREGSLPFDERLRLLIVSMRDSIAQNKAIDLSTTPHREITEALHTLVYEQGDQTELQIKYDDGSRVKPFAVRTLWFPELVPQWKPDQALNIGTLTYRHLDYDQYVDVYLIRDRETRPLTNSQIDALAHDRMLEILSDPLLERESHIGIYQTGLAPLAIGMYRAVVEHLINRRQRNLPPLCLLPIYYADKNSRASGNIWS